MGRRWIATCVLGLAFALAVSGGAAIAKSRGGVDRTFGHGGTLNLEFLLTGEAFHSFPDMAVGPDRSIFLTDREITCTTPVTCSRSLRVIRLRPDGTLDSAYGEGGSARLAAGPEANASFAVDAAGRIVVALTTPGSITVQRLTSDGELDGFFGTAGKTVLPCGCEYARPEVGFDGKGAIAIASSYGVPREASPSENRFLAARLTPNGVPDPDYGTGGFVDLPAPGYEQRTEVRGDGSILLAAAASFSSGLQLIRVTSGGEIDGGFSRRFQRTFRALGLGPEAFSGVADMVLGPRGSVTLLGGAGEGPFEGFGLRVRRDGRLDRSFAGDGFRWFALRPVAAAAGRGRLLVGERAEFGYAAQVFNAAGRRDRSYGGGRTLALEDWLELNGLAMQGKRPLLFTAGYEGCRSYCPPHPKLLRMRALR